MLELGTVLIIHTLLRLFKRNVKIVRACCEWGRILEDRGWIDCSKELVKIASITASYQHYVKLAESPTPSFSDSDRPDDDDDLYLQRQRLLSYRSLHDSKMSPCPEYFHQRVASDLSKRMPHSPPRMPTSLFTIDSILAPRPRHSSPDTSSQAMSVAGLTHRVPAPTLLRHPLHFSHLAAVASGFAPSSSDFLGK